MSEISKNLFVNSVYDKTAVTLIELLAGGTGAGLIGGAAPVIYKRLKGEEISSGKSALTGAGLTSGAYLAYDAVPSLIKNPKAVDPILGVGAVASGLVALPAAYASARLANAIADKIQG